MAKEDYVNLTFMPDISIVHLVISEDNSRPIEIEKIISVFPVVTKPSTCTS